MHLSDHVFLRLPVRQWVLSVPKRLRYFMQRDGATLNMALRIFLRVIAQSLQSGSPGAAQVDNAALHIGAVTFASGIFHPARGVDEAVVAQVQATLRQLILRDFVGRRLLESFEAKEMLSYQTRCQGGRTAPHATGADRPHRRFGMTVMRRRMTGYKPSQTGIWRRNPHQTMRSISASTGDWLMRRF